MKHVLGSRGFLAAYSGLLTVMFTVTVFAGMARPATARFEVLEVERINVLEPDGTPRLVLSNRARFPGLVLRRTEYEHPNRSTAGMLFFNDEGTEQGGLIFGGETDEDGNVSAYGHLSFDQYEQDQVITLNATEGGGLRKAGLSVWDRPEYSTEELMRIIEAAKELPEDERRARVRAFLGQQESAQARMYLGKSQSGAVSLRLNDPEGRERLAIEVGADGTPIVKVLDEEGEVVEQWPAAPRSP
ncbi:MAG: hypothetical protein ACODAA_08850 [Gemmatimonadota bacterium]